MADPQVTPPSPNLRFMIAGHSPQGFLESRTVHCGSREKPGNRGPTCRTVRSLQSGLSGKIAKYGHYSRISAESEWNFSAVQTAWRSGKNSNPRYRSETCKRRRLRKLHGISQFRRFSEDCPLPIRHAKQCGFAKLLEAKPWRLCA